MSLRILVVEHDAAALELMTEILTRFEVEVHAMGDNLEALSLLHQFRFDGIFLDLMMPVVNGYDLARAIRESLCNRTTPIVFITGSNAKSVMQRTFTAGGTLFLQKPIDRHKIRMLLNSTKGLMLDNRRGIRRAAMRTEISCAASGGARSAISCDVSERGIRIESGAAFKPGDQTTLSFHLPDQKKMISATGQVVRIDDNGQARTHFVAIEQTDRQRIRSFVDSQPQAAANQPAGGHF